MFPLRTEQQGREPGRRTRKRAGRKERKNWRGARTVESKEGFRSAPTEREAPTETVGGGSAPTATAEREGVLAATGGNPVTTEGATVTTVAGGAATAAGARAPAETGAGAAVGGATARGGVTGAVAVDTAEAAPGPVIQAGTGGVTATTVGGTGDAAPAETGVTPGDAESSVSQCEWLFSETYTLNI